MLSWLCSGLYRGMSRYYIYDICILCREVLFVDLYYWNCVVCFYCIIIGGIDYLN
ncbi:hypothetical protein BDV24DRAFT_131075 [Aspergillus arachidicola]|uniref:Uncharacterized protein n=1 Tax=Aspergillus arachidicola TaxID=656916 RepID=A0A5N6Y8X1_9EURO|nr:hypothetical protein BDV24DRAFT_131075 [Aspergillus arachidicola]